MIKLNKNKGITLIALVITIIVLLILAGISIATLTGENGLLSKATTAKEETKKAEIREEIELAIAAIQAEELPKGNKVTLETLAGSEEEPGQLENSKDLEGITAKLNGKQITGEYKGYDYTIDENLKVRIGDSVTGINIKYELSPTEYTNKDITLKVTAESTNGGNVNITAPKGIEKNEQGLYIISTNGTYTFTATDGAESKTSSIIIKKIDKLEPKKCEIDTNSSKAKATSIKIVTNAEDADATEEYARSEIAKYKYYIDNEEKGESNKNTYEIEGLSRNTQYRVYVKAYDKAGNEKQSDTWTASTASGDYPTLTLNGMVEPEEGYAADALPKECFDRDFSTFSKVGKAEGCVGDDLKFKIDKQCQGKYITIYCQTPAKYAVDNAGVLTLGTSITDYKSFCGSFLSESSGVTDMTLLCARSLNIPEGALVGAVWSGTNLWERQFNVYEIWCSDQNLSNNVYSNENRP